MLMRRVDELLSLKRAQVGENERIELVEDELGVIISGASQWFVRARYSPRHYLCR
ncbi:hypothetical protein FD15_GL000716 [Liquorilactobacillus sucicola DSM 21376 = JCM 15457]|uniref:Uncharacterized protein n=1 Tax=Liquorilactobacillus sucicola DSM 21376 = JCM 15457 TaxID=1423806 RepID=A0A0R2DT26_9LACO|nr:hypothetical protein FD15_GL000716 [Liquorilactobacillus sucicola DSM 21376 = JCM 15457]